jgi:hypothetical protein
LRNGFRASKKALQQEILENARVQTTNSQRREGVRQAGRELREAAAFILASTWLLTTIVIPAIGNAAFGGSMLVALPKLIRDVYGGGAWLLGAVIASVAFGRITAAVMVGQLRLRRRGIIAFAADIVASLALLSLLSYFHCPPTCFRSWDSWRVSRVAPAEGPSRPSGSRCSMN